jgi:hypothetical protein
MVGTNNLNYNSEGFVLMTMSLGAQFMLNFLMKFREKDREGRERKG